MSRLFTALLSVALALSPAFAQDPPKVDPPKPAVPAQPAATTVTITVMPLAVKNGAFQSQVTEMVPVTEKVTVTEIANGRPVTRTVDVTTYKVVMKTIETKLKDLKATGSDGKAIPGDELEKKLKDGGTLVMHVGKLDAEARKVFKDGTVFVEQAAPPPGFGPMPAPGGPGGVAPAVLPPPPVKK